MNPNRPVLSIHSIGKVNLWDALNKGKHIVRV
jgi:hypothetical protein